MKVKRTIQEWIDGNDSIVLKREAAWYAGILKDRSSYTILWTPSNHQARATKVYLSLATDINNVEVELDW